MTSLDADLVRGWFGRIRNTEEPVMPQLRIVPTVQENLALAAGADLIETAVCGTGVIDDGYGPSGLTELPAAMLQRYLTAFAAGIASARLAFAGAASDDLDSNDVIGEPAAAGDASALAVAAGLNAGAAALHGEIAIGSDRPAQRWGPAEPTAAESARLAGFAAAELVVNGAGLHEIAAAAAGAAINGWRLGLPEHPVERVEYRTRGLVGALLVALEIQTRDPEPPALPASCGALPGQNLGRPFTAEITFTMGLAPAEIRSLTNDLAGLVTELAVWSGGQWPRFHVHTDRAGDVIAQVYAYGTPFDLEITEIG